MTEHRRKVVIVGGGTAGWITAAALASQLGPLLDIKLIESDKIGTVGVGEATIPTHVSFHRLLGIDERDFMRATKATFKLGIAFENWGDIGERYIHSFGKVGKSTWMGDFQHMWYHARENGFAGDFDDYCFELRAAEAGKFAKSDKQGLSHAYHLDASLYAKFLRAYSEARGVERLEGLITSVEQNSETGNISSVVADDGRRITGDLFIDCTGFKRLLIGETLGTEYEDWSHHLPMDRAWAAQTAQDPALPPYTRAIAHDAGWRWRIPLQHRTGNGFVFASEFMDEDAARDAFINALDGPTVTEPRLIRFKTGQLKHSWAKNCIAIGLSSGFMEPLESTSIHLIQIAATRLIQLFPFSDDMAALARHYNQHVEDEVESIRDFLVLHYILTRRTDTPFWSSRKEVPIPETLSSRIELFKQSGQVYQHGLDLFRTDSWLQVMRGQGLEAGGYHRLGAMLKETELKTALDSMRANIAQAVARMPTQADFLKTYLGD